MDELRTPLVDALRLEIEKARNTVALLEDFRNINRDLVARDEELSAENERLKQQVAHLSRVTDEDLAHQFDVLKEETLDAQLARVAAEEELEVVKASLELLKKERTEHGLANINLHRVVMNLESQVRILKRDLSQH